MKRLSNSLHQSEHEQYLNFHSYLLILSILAIDSNLVIRKTIEERRIDTEIEIGSRIQAKSLEIYIYISCVIIVCLGLSKYDEDSILVWKLFV